MRFSWLVITYLITALAIGCKSSSNQEPKPEIALQTGSGDILIVNEGLFQRNNSTLSLAQASSNTIITDVFEQVNNLKLGDTGNDIDVYGGKVYVVVNVSSYLAVLDKRTLKLLKQIPLFDGSRARQPRQIGFADGQAFISCFDGKVVVIDTSSLNQTGLIEAGRNPEGIVVTDRFIAVANSGGLSAPNFDNRVMVYSKATKTLVRTIIVSDNPTSLVAVGRDSVVCYSRSSAQAGSQAELSTINLETGIASSIPKPAGSITASADTVRYLCQQNGALVVVSWPKHNPASTQTTLVNHQIMTPYHFTIDEASGNFLITDARDYVTTGKLIFLDRSGNLVRSMNAGLNPGAITILR